MSGGEQPGGRRPPLVLQDEGPPREPLELLPLSAPARDAVLAARDAVENPALASGVRTVLSALAPLPRPTQARVLESFLLGNPREATSSLLKLIRLARDDRTMLAELMLLAGACTSKWPLLVDLAEDPGMRFTAVDLATRRTLVSHLSRLATEPGPKGEEDPTPLVIMDCLGPLDPNPAEPAPGVSTEVIAAVEALLLQHPAEYARLITAAVIPGGKAKTASGVELRAEQDAPSSAANTRASGTAQGKLPPTVPGKASATSSAGKSGASGTVGKPSTSAEQVQPPSPTPPPPAPYRPPRAALELALTRAKLDTGEAALEALTKLPYRTWSGEGPEFVEGLGKLLERVTAAELPACLILSTPALGPQAFVRLYEGELELYGLVASGRREWSRLPFSSIGPGPHRLLAPTVLIEHFLQGKTLPTLVRTLDPALVWFTV